MTGIFKVAIIGSGPAGLNAAARAGALGLSQILLEETDHLSDTIFKYQKGKHVMATLSNLVLRSEIDFEAGKRETTLGIWDDQIAGHKVNVKLNAEMVKVEGQKVAFRIHLRIGEVAEASLGRCSWQARCTQAPSNRPCHHAMRPQPPDYTTGMMLPAYPVQSTTLRSGKTTLTRRKSDTTQIQARRALQQGAGARLSHLHKLQAFAAPAPVRALVAGLPLRDDQRPAASITLADAPDSAPGSAGSFAGRAAPG